MCPFILKKCGLRGRSVTILYFHPIFLLNQKRINKTYKRQKFTNLLYYINLLKLDIEGSECDVLDKMLDDNILPKYLCIEFDLLLKNKDFNKKTETIGKRLESFGYKILKNDNFNITFELFSK